MVAIVVVEKGTDTTGMGPMGSAEGTMSMFAKRLKNGRGWVENGASAMMTAMVASLDKLTLKTLFGRMKKWTEPSGEKNLPKHYLEKVTSTVGEAMRDNVQYLNGMIGLPVFKALQGVN